VCVSVTRRYCDNGCRITQTAPHIAQGFQFSGAKGLGEIQTGSPQLGRQM